MLKVNSVHKHFKGVHALNDVSLNIEKGTVVAFVGDNGAGKSTLMKCISGSLNADFGTIQFEGENITYSNPQHSRSIGIEMIYQDLGLCKMHNVPTNIFLGRELKSGPFLNRRLMQEKVRQTFSSLGVGIPLNSEVGSLSGGQQQAVAIARAMISEPKLLIMDEPTAALGAKETKNVLQSISALRESGVTVLMITHRLTDVFDVADRVVVLKHGAVISDISPEETDLNELTKQIIGN